MMVDWQGYALEIIPDSTSDSIHIRQAKDGKIQVFAPPRMPKQELIVYLTKNFKHITKSEDTVISSANDSSITLFDSIYTVLINPNIHAAYIRHKKVYVPQLPKTAKQTELLKNQLLQEQIIQQIGFWEENLGFLLEEIRIKKLPKRYFNVHRDTKELVFSQKLCDSPLDILHYIVAQSIFIYLQISEKDTEELYRKHIPNWKHLRRILEFEGSSDFL